MAEKGLGRISKFKLPITMGLIILSAIAVFLIYRITKNNQPPDQVIPLIVDPSVNTGTGVEESPDSGAPLSIRLSEGQPDLQPVESLVQAAGEPNLSGGVEAWAREVDLDMETY